MKKNVLVISSFPRTDGNSELLAKEFARNASSTGNIVEFISLRNKKINYCLGCGFCSEYQKPCPQNDDMPYLLQKMIDSDVIALASPVYFYSFSAQMKTFIDRTCSRYTEISNKDFYFICTSAESLVENPLVFKGTIDAFRDFLDCLENPHEKAKICASGVWKKGDIKNHPALLDAFEKDQNV